MGVEERHAENRAWAFDALEELKAFIDDPDFDGSVEDERAEIDTRRKELEEGKYRVVVLGAFNVGKSTLINAYLGDEFLPRILEECTTKVTHLVKGDELRMRIRLNAEATDDEIRALQEFLDASGVEAEVARVEQGPDLAVTYRRTNPRELRNTLNALITMSSEEDFPRLRSVREKFEAVVAFVPDGRLQEDVELIDSPGVHNIAETGPQMVNDIIPHSHLVVCMLDSQNAGNQHNRAFIESLVQQRRRKVFFVINKADQLNEEEIDPEGRRGPAKDLLRGLRGVVENPELFFVSSLYALLGQELSDGKTTLQDVGRDNKIRIPFGRQQELLTAENPTEAVAAYLVEESRFNALRDRILDYLYAENREGAIVETTCEIVADKAWRYARPLEARLEMARNVPRLEELRREQERLEGELNLRRSQEQDALALHESLATGDGGADEGYNALVEEQFTADRIEFEVIRPLKQWIADRNNLKKAKHSRYRPLAQEMEQRMDAFLQEATAKVNAHADGVEERVRQRVVATLDSDAQVGGAAVEPPHAEVAPIHAGMGKSYLLWALVGAIVGAAAGGALGYFTQVETYATPYLPPDVVLPMGVLTGAVGAILGLILGLVARASGSDDSRREKLEQVIQERTEQILRRDGREQLRRRANERRNAFNASVESSYGRIIRDLEGEAGSVRREADDLASTQEETVTRLEPKVQRLRDLGQRAREAAGVWRARAEASIP